MSSTEPTLRPGRLQGSGRTLLQEEHSVKIGKSIDYHDSKLIFNSTSGGYDAEYLEKIYFDNTEKHGLMPIAISRSQGKFLYLQTKLARAKRVIEVGMLGGYSTLWLAYALPADGKVTTFDIDPHAAKVARANFEGAGQEINKKIDIVLGSAVTELAKLPTPTTREEEVDLLFIDADKEGYPAYYKEAKRLAPHGLVIFDNMVYGGNVADPNYAGGKGQRDVLDLIEKDPAAEAVTIHAISDKSVDGFTTVLLS